MLRQASAPATEQVSAAPKQTGDTLIEVMFAVSVFALVVVGSLLLMNQGLNVAQRSVEITQVRQQVDGQAETLRFLRDSYIAVYEPGISFTTPAQIASPAGQWNRIVTSATVAAASRFDDDTRECNSVPNRSFVVNPQLVQYVPLGANYVSPVTFAQLNLATDGALTNSQGLWVEAVQSPTTGNADRDKAAYIDFHIRACWSSPGLDKLSRIGTIVRLYAPRA